MFTGIVEEIGTVRSIVRGSAGATIEIGAEKVLEGTSVGDSISTDGVCLTVVSLKDGAFVADIMPETVRCSSLGMLRPGDKVSLERAMRADGRFGGHIVTGHIDGVGRISGMVRDDNAVRVTVRTGEELMRYVVRKGSVAVDGVSLTVADVSTDGFTVSVIPHTGECTALMRKRVGDAVNIENDIIAKYVERLSGGTSGRGGLSLEFLAENGF